MIRRFGEPLLRGQRYRLRVGAYAVLARGAQVLLTHQSQPRSEYQLPGGGIDAGETAVQALRREVFEETGWGIATPRRIGAFRRFVFMPEYDLWAEKLCLIYLARPTRRLAPPAESGHRAIWVTAAEADWLLGNPGDRQFLRRALKLG
jgi:8-oxo-dGTP diphosphatase